MNYLPVSLFGSVMGLVGLSIAYRLAHELFGISMAYSHAITIIALAVFIALSIGYLIKIFTSFDAFKAEFQNTLTKPFFGTFNISILLLPIVLSEFAPNVAKIMWLTGVVLMTLFAVHQVSHWFNKSNVTVAITPAWIIPVVGTLDIPLAQNTLNLHSDLGIAMLAIGLFFGIPILGLVMTRLFIHDTMPEKLTPTLMILIAPFSVGFSTYTEVVGKIDELAKALYFIGLFLFFALLKRLWKATKSDFKITWWAISFPIAALLISTLKMALHTQEKYLIALSMIFLAIFTITIVYLLFRTLFVATKGKLKDIV